ncbi:DUF563 domain-containing protein [Colletotrichum orchidophilum]|uniref:DUF563 domain-containing protein n=1 Tax=Colletotrichum orchidophilum TaxID=1209926 RepID=A0A1G4BEP2_9PEZI|nr:DUF563 domain-containing protein [Colletotrichum orchidophilum]OHE99772.1 DUF563 domain-containing protein [Colletotrichum orchidophilum]
MWPKPSFPTTSTPSTLPRCLFADQLRIVQFNSVLVGVHGAGIMHNMFLREGGAAVVEIQPSSMFYEGFRRMARMMGQTYVSNHVDMVGAEDWSKRSKRSKRYVGKRERWHYADIRIDEDRFIELITQVVDSLVYNDTLGMDGMDGP